MAREGLIPRSDEPFFTLRINYPEHEHIVALERAEPKWLHTVALAQCNQHLTDGHIDPFRLRVICAIAEVPKPNVWVKRLVDGGVWIELGDGHYEIRDFLDYNPSAERVRALREARREAGRLGGQAKAEASAEADALASATANAKADAKASALADKKRVEREKEIDQGQGLTHSGFEFFPALGKPEKPHPLGAGRDEALALLASRVTGGDAGTLHVLWKYCKPLPKERIEGVAEKFSKRSVKPGVAVNALKAAYDEYHRELRAVAL